ncbi:MAG: hypothetical protein JSW50_00470, partial [Candidatus Latescibacterota bacterium]
LDCLNVMPSRYFVSLWISSFGGVKYDALDHCVALDVESADPYGTGKGIESRFGLVYMTGNWTYERPRAQSRLPGAIRRRRRGESE